MINIAEYPILSSFLNDDVQLISYQDALFIYRTNWHKINTKELTENELKLVNDLIKEYGNGHLLFSAS